MYVVLANWTYTVCTGDMAWKKLIDKHLLHSMQNCTERKTARPWKMDLTVVRDHSLITNVHSGCGVFTNLFFLVMCPYKWWTCRNASFYLLNIQTCKLFWCWPYLSAYFFWTSVKRLIWNLEHLVLSANGHGHSVQWSSDYKTGVDREFGFGATRWHR